MSGDRELLEGVTALILCYVPAIDHSTNDETKGGISNDELKATPYGKAASRTFPLG